MARDGRHRQDHLNNCVPFGTPEVTPLQSQGAALIARLLCQRSGGASRHSRGVSK
jgi:hypothetical protein